MIGKFILKPAVSLVVLLAVLLGLMIGGMHQSNGMINVEFFMMAGLFMAAFCLHVFHCWKKYDYWQNNQKKYLINHLEEIQSNFISLLSHNLNTPIAKLHGYLQLFRQTENAQSDCNAISHYLSNIRFITSSVIYRAALLDSKVAKNHVTCDQLIKQLSGFDWKGNCGFAASVNVGCLTGTEELLQLPIIFDLQKLKFYVQLVAISIAGEGSAPIEIKIAAVILGEGNDSGATQKAFAFYFKSDALLAKATQLISYLHGNSPTDINARGMWENAFQSRAYASFLEQFSQFYGLKARQVAENEIELIIPGTSQD